MRKCGNCANRMFEGWCGKEFCMLYEMSTSEQEEIECAKDCENYVEETNENEDDNYIPSSTNGDYSPSCPWNAPGMSIHDFI